MLNTVMVFFMMAVETMDIMRGGYNANPGVAKGGNNSCINDNSNKVKKKKKTNIFGKQKTCNKQHKV